MKIILNILWAIGLTLIIAHVAHAEPPTVNLDIWAPVHVQHEWKGGSDPKGNPDKQGGPRA